MKGKIVHVALFGSILFQMLACNSVVEKTETVLIDKDQIKMEIQAKEDSFAAVYNSGEMKNIGYYSDDATSFFQNRPALVGKQAIIEFLKSDLVSNTNKISFQTKEVFPSSDGNQVVEIGYFTVVDSTNTPINTGNYISLFEKQNGKYVCLRDMSASDRPIQ
jgi:ketosteroid isomerase-like protein